MKTQEKLQSFILPFLGGLFGILFGYVYTLLRHDASASYALIIGCVAGVIIGAFATKMVKIKLPTFSKMPKIPKEQRVIKLSRMDVAIRKYDRKRKAYGFFAIAIPEIILSAVIISILLFVFSIYSEFFQNRGFGLVLWFGWGFFAVVPWGMSSYDNTLKKFSLQKGKGSWFFEVDITKRSKWARLRYFNNHVWKFFWKNTLHILKLEFAYSFLLFLPFVIFGSFMLGVGLICIVLWIIFAVIYGVLRGIFALLGKTLFWSSLLVAIAVVFYSWSTSGLFINNPLTAILLSFATGIFAGAIHYFLVYPLCKWVSNSLRNMEKEYSKDDSSFLINISGYIIDRPWKYSWKFADEKYCKKIFKD